MSKSSRFKFLILHYIKQKQENAAITCRMFSEAVKQLNGA